MKKQVENNQFSKKRTVKLTEASAKDQLKTHSLLLKLTEVGYHETKRLENKPNKLK